MKLKLVSTPIGNSMDITLRGLEALKNSSIILAEDTRVTKKLLEMLEIDFSGKKIISFNDHDQSKIPHLVNGFKDQEVTLVSDAGSPVISDPAYPLIKYIIDNGGVVETVPGVSAVTSAIELSGLAPQPNTFHGFLGRKENEIKSKLLECENFGGLHIFFEAPHRILATLEIIANSYPELEISVSREITKKFETTYRFTAKDFKQQEITDKGEFVICLLMPKKKSSSNTELIELTNNYLKKKTPKNLAKLLSQITGMSTSEAYEQITN